MNINRSLKIGIILLLNISMPVWSNEDKSILLTVPSQHSSAIKETTFDIPQKKSTSAEIAKKKMFAKEDHYGQKTASKFGNGMLDVVTSVLEIPKTIIKTTEEDGILSGLTVGFVKGVANTASQAVSGAVNVATFPIPHEIENPMKPKRSNIEDVNMEDELGAAFAEKPE